MPYEQEIGSTAKIDIHNSQRASPTVSIIAIIPAFNEEISIGSVVLKTRSMVSRVIVVDDGSTDSTSIIAILAGAEVIRLEKNQGKGHAMMAGFNRARELDPDVVVMLDADGQHNPAEIKDLIPQVINGEADLVIGSRFLVDGNKIPRYRQAGQKTLDFATKLSSGFASTDSQSGFRAISRKGLQNLNFKSEDYNIESDMITQFLTRGLSIREAPITVQYEVPNKHKKNPFTHGFDIVGHLVGILGYKRPLLSFGIPGTLSVLVGLLFGSWAFSTYQITSKFPFDLTMLGALFMIMGLLLVTTAFILNSLVQLVKMER